MKNFLRYILMFVFLQCMNVNIFAVDFTIGDLGYTITSPSNLEVEVASCANIEKVVIPETVNYKNRTYTVTGIGSYAFDNNNSQKSKTKFVILPQKLKKIESNAFRCCLFENIELPKNLQEIDYRAFNDCEKLESIIIPASVNAIGENAFSECKNLMEVFFLKTECQTIAYSYQYVSHPFYNCHSALTFYVPNSENYKVLDPKRVVEYISFSNNNFEYSGKAPSFEWGNNLKAYNGPPAKACGLGIDFH